MPNEADGNKDVLLSHGDSASEINILSRTHDCVHKTASNDRHALFPVWVHATVPFVVLWKRVVHYSFQIVAVLSRQPHCSLATKLEDSGKPARLTGACPTGSLRNQTNHVSFRLHAIPGTTCPELCGSSMPPLPPPIPGGRRFCRRILVVR